MKRGQRDLWCRACCAAQRSFTNTGASRSNSSGLPASPQLPKQANFTRRSQADAISQLFNQWFLREVGSAQTGGILRPELPDLGESVPLAIAWPQLSVMLGSSLKKAQAESIIWVTPHYVAKMVAVFSPRRGLSVPRCCVDGYRWLQCRRASSLGHHYSERWT